MELDSGKCSCVAGYETKEQKISGKVMRTCQFKCDKFNGWEVNKDNNGCNC